MNGRSAKSRRGPYPSFGAESPNRTFHDLANQLQRIDGRQYPAYKDIIGEFAFTNFVLSIDKVQGDPFAAPSRLSIRLPHATSKLPSTLFSNVSRLTGTENFLALSFSRACQKASAHLGSGKSGLIAIDTPKQEMLARSCIEIDDTTTTVRFSVGLPANGRRIRGHAAAALLTEQISKIVEDSLCFKSLDSEKLNSYANAAEDADFLRSALDSLGSVAFVADGSILPRASGIDPRPLKEAIPFTSPDSLRKTITLPNAGPVSGMAIPKGVTLIVGGGYHGKSTLLAAIERGVYNHCPGDGRELVVSRRDSTKVRAEDGRSVASVDLTPFINNLPGGKSALTFSTENASGSSSQAANIIEALETGTRTLLIDEDISASNLLIRDARMQQLIAPDKEPITPFVQRVRALYENFGVSTIIVLGGSSDYFEPADLVVAMDNYLPCDVTIKAKSLCKDSVHYPQSGATVLCTAPEDSKRYAESVSVNPYIFRKGSKQSKIKANGTQTLTFGDQNIDISLVPQLIDESQTRAIGTALRYVVENGLLETNPIPLALKKAVNYVSENRLSCLGSGDLAEFRLQELTAVLNRMRSLMLQQP